MLTRWFKRAVGELLTSGRAENPRDIRNNPVSYDKNILVKDYLTITEIHLGRGITNPTIDNISLEIFLTSITELDINVTEIEDKIQISIKGLKTFDTDQTINEIGLIGLFKGSKVLFDRTRLEPNISISSGQTLMVEYKLTF
jgi:hypothetical protein